MNVTTRLADAGSSASAAHLGIVAVLFAVGSISNAQGQVAPSLGTAQSFAALGATTLTNTGPTTISGDVGVSPGTAITGFPPGVINNGHTHAADSSADQAQTDASAAYTKLSNQTCTTTFDVPTDIGGSTLQPGVYCFASSAAITGILKLDAAGNPNAAWVFKIGSSLTTATDSQVLPINGAQACRVFWRLGSSGTLGTGTAFTGTVLALASITLNTDATVAGHALALNGAVTMDTNSVSVSNCACNCGSITSTIVKTIDVAPAVTDSSGSVSGSVFGAALSPDSKTVWVSGYNGTTNPGFISFIDVASQTVGNQVQVGRGPADITFTEPGHRAYVSNMFGDSLSIFDVTQMKVRQTMNLSSVPLDRPFGLAYSSGRIFVTTQGSGNLIASLKNLAALHVDHATSTKGPSGRPAVVPSGASVYADALLIPVFHLTNVAGNKGYPELLVVKASTSKVLARMSLKLSKASPQAVVVSPDGATAYVSLAGSSSSTSGVWVVDLLSLETRAMISTGDSTNQGEAISADGKYLLVAGSSVDQVAVICTATNTVIDTIAGGAGPNAVVLTRDNSQAFVTNSTDGTVTVVAFAPKL